VIRKHKAAQDIEVQLAALEAQLRREQGLQSEMPALADDTQREIQEMAAD